MFPCFEDENDMVLSSFISISPENCKRNTVLVTSSHRVLGYYLLSSFISGNLKENQGLQIMSPSLLFVLIISGFLSSM